MRMSQLIEQFTMLRPRLVRAGRTPGTFGDCLQVYLDNVNMGGVPLDSSVLPVEVAGVEVYRATTALPTDLMRFQSRCNLVLIWTA